MSSSRTSISSISIHSLPKEGDALTSRCGRKDHDFNPLPPQGGRRPHRHPVPVSVMRFQSTPSPRRETRKPCSRPPQSEHFNPLPPQGGRQKNTRGFAIGFLFQSTPSPRRETFRDNHAAPADRCYFNPLPPQGGRRSAVRVRIRGQTISIHSLPKEGDAIDRCAASTISLFQSTPSPRRETTQPFPHWSAGQISIHSLPKEGDSDY